MKKTLSFVLAIVLCLTSICLMATTAIAEVPERVYLSDTGLDENDGLTAATPVKTIGKAITLLGGSTANGIVEVVGTYTYSSYYLIKAKKLTFHGYDSTSVFQMGSARVSEGAGIAINSDITFDNIKLQLGKCGIGCFFLYSYVFECTSTVTSIPAPDAGESPAANAYPCIVGYYKSAYDKGSTIILNGGTFNTVNAGTQAAALTGDSTIAIGGNAKVVGSVQPAYGKGGSSIGNLSINISGGEIAKLDLGATLSATPTYTEDVSVTISAGTVSEITIPTKDKFASGKKMSFDFTGNVNIQTAYSMLLADAGYSVTPSPYLTDVYVSDTGLDTNTGLDAQNPVKTIKKAVTLLGGESAKGNVIIVGTYTYTQTQDGYLLPKATRLTIKGNDENAMLKMERGFWLNSDLSLETLTLQLTAATPVWTVIYTKGYSFTVYDSVKCIASSAENEKVTNAYPHIIAGDKDNLAKGSTMVLEGGTFGNVYLASEEGITTGDISLTFGKNAVVMGTLDIAYPKAGVGIYKANVSITGGSISKLDFSASKATDVAYNDDISIEIRKEAAIGAIASPAKTAFATGKNATIDLTHNKELATKEAANLKGKGFIVLEEAPFYSYDSIYETVKFQNFTTGADAAFDENAKTAYDGSITGVFANRTVLTGITIIPENEITNLVIYGSEDGNTWIKLYEEVYSSVEYPTQFGTPGYNESGVGVITGGLRDEMYTYALKYLRVETETGKIAELSMRGYEVDIDGYLMNLDETFGMNGYTVSLSHYDPPKTKYVFDHIIGADWNKGDAIKAVTDDATKTAFLQVKLEKATKLSEIAFAARSGEADTIYTRWNAVRFEASVDGQNWVTLATTLKDFSDVHNMKNFTICVLDVTDDTAYSYVRLVSDINSVNKGWLTLAEFEVYGAVEKTAVDEAAILTAWESDPHEAETEETTVEEKETNNEPSTRSDDVNTNENNTKAIDEVEKKGCGSVISFGILSMVTLMGVALTCSKKKHD